MRAVAIARKTLDRLSAELLNRGRLGYDGHPQIHQYL